MLEEPTEELADDEKSDRPYGLKTRFLDGASRYRAWHYRHRKKIHWGILFGFIFTVIYAGIFNASLPQKASSTVDKTSKVVVDSEYSLVKKDTSDVLRAKTGETEIVDQRTQNFKKFQLPDGKVRVAGDVAPIHYRTDPFNTTEPFKEIDLSINSISDKDWNYAMQSSGYQIDIANSQKIKGEDVNYIAKFSRAGENISMAPAVLAWENSAGEFQQISKPIAGIAPDIDNTNYTITWKNAFGNGLDFRYNLSSDKFFKTVIVNDKSNLPTATIGADGLKLTIVMAMSWSNVEAKNDFASSKKNTELSVDYISSASKDESKDNLDQFGYKDSQNRDLWFLQNPLAWDSSEKQNLFQMDWSLVRSGSSTFMKLSTKDSDLNQVNTTYPFYMDTAITEEQTPATADDIWYIYSPPTFYTTSGWNDFGHDYDPEGSYFSALDAALRFTTIPIPQGATIDSATISLRSYNSWSNTTQAKIRAQAEDTATQITSGAIYLARTWTTAQTNWTPSSWTSGTWYSTPDIKTVVKEVTDRAGWVSDNSIGFQIADNGSADDAFRQFYDYSSGSTSAAKFNATYTEASSGPTVPGAPTSAVATRGNASASVAFTAPASDGGATITGYTVTSTPGSFTGTGASSPITVSGLTNGTSYTFTVHATNSAGDSAESSPSSAVVPATNPGAPTIGTATAGNVSASVAFSAPGSNGGSAITGYTVTSSPGGFTGTGASSPITVSGLTNGTTYTFTVHATNTIGNSSESAVSNSAIPFTVPGAPTAAVATRGNTSASIAFSAPGSDGGATITGYTVTSTPGSFTGTGATSPITVSGLTNGTSYTFTVHATNSAGNSTESSPSVAVIPATNPGAPTSVVATAGSGQMSVAFSAPGSNGGDTITGYTVISTPGNYTNSGSSSPIIVSGLAVNTAYTFTMHATNTVGNSSESSASTSKYTLSSVPSVSTAAGYDGTSNYHIDATIDPGTNPEGTYYWLQSSTDNVTYSDPPGMAWQTETSYILSDLSSYTQYYLKVKSKNGDAVSSVYSSSSSAVTAPAAPTSLEATNVCRTSALITWVASPGANEYFVVSGTNPDFMFTQPSFVHINTTSYTLPNLTNNTTYYYNVYASSGGHNGASTATQSFTTGSCTAPIAPADFAGFAVSSSQINWTWTDTADDETSWRVQDASSSNISASLGSGTTSYNETVLSPNTAYSRKVNVLNANGNNDSNIVTVYTLANVPSAPTLVTLSTNSIKITINANSNPVATRYAIYNETAGKYVKHADGTLQDTADWQLYADWGGASGFINNSLVAGTSYVYKVKARNGDSTETAFSATATQKTTDPTVALTSTTGSASISTASVNIPVSLSEVSGSNIGVDYAISGGTAQNNTDYTISGSTASILAGSTSANIPLTIINNHLVGSNKTITLAISSPTNASLGTNQTHTFTIINDNVGPSGSFTINSGATKANNQTVHLALAYSLATEVKISTSSDFTGADYQAVSSSIDASLVDQDGAQTVYVKYKDQYGNESPSYSHSITLDRVAPAIPTNLAQVSGNNSISLSWTNSTDSDFAKVKLYRGTSANFDIADADKTFETNAPLATYLDTDVNNNQNYYYKAVAIDDVDNASTASDEVNGRPDSDNPTTPGNPTISENTVSLDGKTLINSRKVTINWTASSDVNSGLKGYYLSIGKTSGASDVLNNTEIASSATTYNFEATEDGIYYIRVSAKDNKDNSSASSDELALYMDTIAPSDPGLVQMFDVSNRSDGVFAAIISWKLSADTLSSVKNYSIYRSGTLITDDPNSYSVDDKTGYGYYIDIQSANAKLSYAVMTTDNALNKTGQITAKLAETELSRLTGQTSGANEISLPEVIIGEGKLELSDIAVEPSQVAGQKTQAKISWKTSVPATSLVWYGTSSSYTSKTTLDTGLNSSHTVILPDLTLATTYHFKVTSSDKSGKEISSGDQTFTSANQAKQTDVLSMISESLANSFIRIWNSIIGLFGANSARAADSSAEIKSLSVINVSTADQTIYAVYWPKNKGKVSLQRSDGGGFTTVAETDKNFYLDFAPKSQNGYTYKIADLQANAQDELSGKSNISGIDIEAGAVSKDQASVIVQFKTDKLARSQVEYGEGSLTTKTDLDQSLNQSHLVLIEKLKPSTTYSFRLRVEDKSGKEITESQMQSFTTPKSPTEVTTFELIVHALQSAFAGFDKFMKN